MPERVSGPPRWIALVPSAISAATLLSLRPNLLFRTSTPAFTDLTGHIFAPFFLATELLPSLSFRGWSMDWFTGFPIYYFYPPLPGVFSALWGLFLGESLAVRISMVLSLIALPWALLAFARWSRLTTESTIGAVLGGSGLLLMASYWALGGNILSAISGEFYYAWSLVFTVLYLGLIVGAEPASLGGKVAGLVLAAAILSHVLPALAACMGLLPFLFYRPLRRTILESWLTAALLTAFWTLPLFVRFDQIGDIGWNYVPGVKDILPIEIVLLLPVAVVGGVTHRRSLGLAVLLSTGVVGVVVTIVPQSLVMRGRLLPLWFLAIHVLAGLGVAWAWRAVRSRRWLPGLAVMSLGAGSIAMLIAVRGVAPWREGSRMIFEGLPSTEGYGELDQLVRRLRELPSGRVHWEPGDLSRWGNEDAFALIPMWTHHTTLSGFLRESSGLTPFITQLNAELGQDEVSPPYSLERPTATWNPRAALLKLRMLGVRYQITHSADTRDILAGALSSPPDQFGALRLFDLGEVPFVTPLECSDVEAGHHAQTDWDAWWVAWEPGKPVLVDDPRGELFEGSPCVSPADSEPVTILHFDHESLRLKTSHVGTPHLLRIAFFPNWHAEGARGPFRATPWFMVFVPQSEIVELHFQPTWAERTGWFLTLLGCGALLLSSFRPRSLSQRKRTPSREEVL